MSEDSSYIHGTTPEEQRRLTAMNEMLNPTSVGMMSLRGSRKVLDAGSGLGQLTRAIARTAGPGAKIVGVERSQAQIDEALRQAKEAGEEGSVEFRKGDADHLPLREDEWGSFDIVHSRFLLEHLSNPETAVKAMVKALRPGGRIILEDDDHAAMRLWPEPGGFGRLWSSYVASFTRLKSDPFVGRRLISLIHGAGASPMRNNNLSVSGCSGSPSFGPIFDILCALLEGARQTMISEKLIAEVQFESGMASLREWGLAPNAALWYSTCWAEGKRPPRGTASS